MKEFGRLDGAFNNAGVVGEMGPVADMGLGNWNDVIAVNLTSAFLAAKAQIPVMKKRGQGSIVFTSQRRLRRQPFSYFPTGRPS